MRVGSVLWIVTGAAAALVVVAREGGAEPPLPRAHPVLREGDTQGQLTPASVRSPAPEAPVVRAKRTFTATGCSDDMVRVAGRFCIDRYEASMVDDDTERPLSPYYPPLPSTMRTIFVEWTQRLADGHAGANMPLPALADWQREQSFRPRAISRPNVVPHGYLNAIVAGKACASAGKRLCTQEEWTTACRGERDTKFPYGATYRANVCNVFRQSHPGMILHGNFSLDLLDPRMNVVTSEGEPLLRATGATIGCKSQWGDDAVYDMVGNLDEWIEDQGGTFMGGFYARSTRQGCDAKVTAHRPNYLDYSTGVRCCDALR
ncbi:MAG TPA: SUMF1/EgtB/PvdO family nonheme iron enzyme [Polyangiaceae bacterium]